MSSHKKEKLQSLFRKLVSEFLRQVDFKDSFVNVTRVEFSDNLKNAKIFVSSFPEENEKETLKTLEGQKNSLKKYIISKTKLKFLPLLKIEADKGEKNRRRIEELLKR